MERAASGPEPEAPLSEECALTISVLIATYGDESWADLARTRALSSVGKQTMQPEEVLVLHDANGSLASVRNELALRATGDLLIFVDADDELRPGYVQAMSNARDGDILQPAVQFITPGQPHKPPKLFDPISLSRGNYLVISCAMSRGLFWEAGGFDPQWEAFEDWSLFRRMVYLGARIVGVPRAVYVAHWNHAGRNNTVRDAQGLMARIGADYDAWSASL